MWTQCVPYDFVGSSSLQAKGSEKIKVENFAFLFNSKCKCLMVFVEALDLITKASKQKMLTW